jgi:hypothetical protein
MATWYDKLIESTKSTDTRSNSLNVTETGIGHHVG